MNRKPYDSMSAVEGDFAIGNIFYMSTDIASQEIADPGAERRIVKLEDSEITDTIALNDQIAFLAELRVMVHLA
jgi:hypothetical protein